MIPARGGSKGLPRKNLQPIGGVPLVGWAVRAARAAQRIERVCVSTDDGEIAEAAREFGAEVIARPADLAADDTPTAPVIRHALDVVAEPFDAVAVLQCASPFTAAADIDAAVEQLETTPACSVLAVTPASSLACRVKGNCVEGATWDFAGTRPPRQAAECEYRYLGALCVTRTSQVDGVQPMTVPPCGFVTIPPERAVDVDTPLDLHLADALWRYQKTWLVVGGSPGAPGQLAALVARYPTSKRITTNSGWKLFHDSGQRLDAYFLTDTTACATHGPMVRLHLHPNTRTITLRRELTALQKRGVDWFDEFLPSDRPESGKPPAFRPGAYSQSCGLSGLFCLQYALNHGARRVHLIGMEGYSGQGNDYWDDGQTQPKHGEHTERLIRPFLQSCIDTCPRVHFIAHGELRYPLTGENLSLEPQP